MINITSTVRGFQIFHHWLMMLFQAFKNTRKISFFLGCILTLFLCIYYIHPKEVVKTFDYYRASLIGSFLDLSPSKHSNESRYIHDSWTQEVLHVDYVRNSSHYLRLVEKVKDRIIWGIGVGYTASWVISTLSFLLYSIYGNRKIAEKVITQTNQVLTIKQANKINLTNKKKQYKIGKIYLPIESEKKHIVMLGSSGSGKSNTMKLLLQDIRKKGDKVIIVDTDGDYVKEFYRHGTDALINPLDERSKNWNLWSDADNEEEYSKLASYLIPETPGDGKYWSQASRRLFTGLLKIFEKTKNNQKLYQAINSLSPQELSVLLKGEPGETEMRTSSTQAASIKSVLAAEIEWIKLLDPVGDYSIKKWLEDEDDKGWLFITCTKTQRPTHISRINLQFYLALNHLSTLTEGHGLIWTFVDELTSLKSPRNLKQATAESRKDGAPLVIAAQSITQIFEMFGTDGAESILDNIATKVFCKAQSKKSSYWLSEELGHKEANIKKESTSFGESTMRDAVSISTHKEKTALVHPDVIRKLKIGEVLIEITEANIVVQSQLPLFKSSKTVEKFKAKPIQKQNVEEINIVESIENKDTQFLTIKKGVENVEEIQIVKDIEEIKMTEN